MNFENTVGFAGVSDASDPLRKFRSKFYIPEINGEECVYFCGNSLGLQPKTTSDYINLELKDWAKHGVEGHFYAQNPWFSYHENFSEKTAKLVGALPSEVIIMNQLTVNVHLLLVSFYKPNAKRYKIICEAKAFSSDQYALESQVKFHGLDPADAIIEISPREGEHTIRTEDILTAIDQHKDGLALVFIGGVNYFTGQFFDLKAITEAAHRVGAVAGFDLAHAAGNVKLELHSWNVDFAAWCSYKYLNSGPGGVAGAFIHEKHHDVEIPRLAGWWGHDKTSRFKMEKGFIPIKSAEGWQISNAPVLSMAAYKASLEIFDEAGMDILNKKSELLTEYLEFIINEVNNEKDIIRVLTPSKKSERGCQLSLVIKGMGKEVFKKLHENRVVADWREPNVIRVAPVPLYNTFTDVWKFGQALKKSINNLE